MSQASANSVPAPRASLLPLRLQPAVCRSGDVVVRRGTGGGSADLHGLLRVFDDMRKYLRAEGRTPVFAGADKRSIRSHGRPAAPRANRI